jgi:hypothetical protein
VPRTKREEAAALITILALIEGVFFDTHDFRRLPYQRDLVTRALKSLVESNVLMKIHDRRNYVLTPEFRETLKREVGEKRPQSGIHQFPSLDVFYIGGMEEWSEHDFELYVGGMRDVWQHLSRDRTLPERGSQVHGVNLSREG